MKLRSQLENFPLLPKWTHVHQSTLGESNKLQIKLFLLTFSPYFHFDIMRECQRLFWWQVFYMLASLSSINPVTTRNEVTLPWLAFTDLCCILSITPCILNSKPPAKCSGPRFLLLASGLLFLDLSLFPVGNLKVACVQSFFTSTDYFGYVPWEKSEMIRVGILSNHCHFHFVIVPTSIFLPTDLLFLMGLETCFMWRNWSSFLICSPILRIVPFLILFAVAFFVRNILPLAEFWVFSTFASPRHSSLSISGLWIYN